MNIDLRFSRRSQRLEDVVECTVKTARVFRAAINQSENKFEQHKFKNDLAKLK